MKKIDTSKWKEFLIGDLFDIHPTKAYKKINIEILYLIFDYPYKHYTFKYFEV